MVYLYKKPLYKPAAWVTKDRRVNLNRHSQTRTKTCVSLQKRKGGRGDLSDPSLWLCSSPYMQREMYVHLTKPLYELFFKQQMQRCCTLMLKDPNSVCLESLSWQLSKESACFSTVCSSMPASFSAAEGKKKYVWHSFLPQMNLWFHCFNSKFNLANATRFKGVEGKCIKTIKL